MKEGKFSGEDACRISTGSRYDVLGLRQARPGYSENALRCYSSAEHFYDRLISN